MICKSCSRSVGYKIPLWLGYKRRNSDHLEAVPYENQTLTQDDVNQLKTVLENRINTLGLGEIKIMMIRVIGNE